MKTTAILLLLLLAIPALAKLKTPDAVRTIIGEAATEPYRGMVATACVLRNRGTTHGSYGFNVSNDWLAAQPAAVQRRASKAWLASAKKDITGGCDMFGGIIDDWYFIGILHLKPVMTIGHQRFYKSK